MENNDHSPRLETLEKPRQIAVLVFLAVGVWYLVWRALTINWQAPLFSLAIYFAEIVSFSMAGLHIWMCWTLTVRKAPPAPAGMSVDVFVTSYNESVDLLRKTLIAAIKMQYPHRTWLLDDGNRAEMRTLCAELGCRYLARKDNTHAKAGNLNNALARTSGDFIAIFDADHAPKADFLVKTLGYFTRPNVAFVQTPQDFYNLDSYQHRWRADKKTVWTEQSLFFRVIQRGKDARNAAFFCGSCAVIRRSALAAIGGFATGTVTEDLHTSIRIHANGYDSVYHAEPLAFGIAPESISPFITQRVRWGQGAMHVWRKEGILSRRGLSWAQRINYFVSVSTYFDGWIKTLFYTAPVLVLCTGVLPLVAETDAFLLHFLPYYLLSFLAFEEVGRGYGRSLFIEQYNMTRFAAFAWSTLALVLPKLRFCVTPKGSAAGAGEPMTLPQWLVMAANLAAIPAGIALYTLWQGLPLQALIANVLWASINVGLAAAVLRFTRRIGRNRRSAYRFPIPLFGSLTFADGSRFCGTIDDISAGGFRFYGRLPESLARDERLRGEIVLPDGPLALGGEVRALIAPNRHSPEPRGLSCAMQLASAERERLEAFLFGTNLQWQINGYVDQVSTPLSRLLPRLVAPVLKQLVSARLWKAVQLIPCDKPGAAAVSGLLSVADGGAQRYLLSFTALAADRNWLLDGFARRRSALSIVGVDSCREVEIAGGTLHVYRLRQRVAGESKPPVRADVAPLVAGQGVAGLAPAYQQRAPDLN